MAQPRSRIPLLLGLTAAGAGGYYLYAAGGDTKVAGKKVERKSTTVPMPTLTDVSVDDAATAEARMRGQNYSAKEARKQGEEWAQIAGSKIDHTVDDARKSLHEADAKILHKASEANGKLHEVAHDSKAKLEQIGKETQKDLHQTVENFDKTVERKTVEAKNGISSWFGFGGK